MTSRLPLFLALSLIAAAAVAGAPVLGQITTATPAAPFQTIDETRAALGAARAEQRMASMRAQLLEQQAAQAGASADRTARLSAALAARIQQSEAEIAASRAAGQLIARNRMALRARLAARQEPVVRLTAALQLMSRRPLALGLLRPGSLDNMVHLRAMLETMLPVIRQRTAALRAEIVHGRVLQQQAANAQRALEDSQARLGDRRRQLAALESRQRLASRAVRGSANREADRALALAEQTRDLGSLIGQLETAGALRRELAALPGPVLRPSRPGEAQVVEVAGAAVASARLSYILPVAGPVVTGFGEASSGGGLRAKGLTLAPRSGAQVVAPAAGRVVFAGPYRGYGRIAIIEHPGGWTTLITDLATLSVSVGDDLVQGAPLGTAGPGRPTVTVELRKNGVPVDTLEVLGGP
ncbi:murein hydrolase activator EnvC family protein [Novosphingobium tardum]|uniref:Murein hydrolase activator EnvC family protein n=1 Tax=Novosphingobium tardum TaxID=1538021 RepID=A0ABV8RKM9_9SPHN